MTFAKASTPRTRAYVPAVEPSSDTRSSSSPASTSARPSRWLSVIALELNRTVAPRLLR